MSRNRQDLPELATDEQTISSNLASGSKRFHASPSRKLGQEPKRGMKGEGEGRKATDFSSVPHPS